MIPDHAYFAEWDAAYVLGALSPAERREFEEHIATCDECRRSVAELAPMPGLLARLSEERAEGLLDDSEVATAFPRDDILAAVRREDGRRRALRRRVWISSAVAVAVAAVAVVLVAIVVPLAIDRSAPDVQSIALETVSDAPLSATVTLTPVAWGTSIDLDCRYESDGSSDAPEDGWPYALYIVDRDGEGSEVSSWRASPGTTARLAAGTAVDLDDIASLEIRAVGSGRVLMRGVPD